MINLITPELKDKLLFDLLSPGSMSVQANIRQVAKDFQTSPDIAQAVYDQFESLGLMKQTKCIGGNIYIQLNASAHDLYRRGGFTVQEEILKANIEKLGRELDLLAKQLSPDLSKKASEIASIGSNILSALAFFNS